MAAGCATHTAPPAPEPAVDGRCAGEPGICLLGVPAPLEEGAEIIGWRCLGINGGADAACALPAAAPAPRTAAVAVAAPAAGVAQAAGAAPRPETVAATQAAARQAPVAPRAQTQIAALLAAKAQRTPAQRKVGSRLLELAAAEALRASDPPGPRDPEPPAGPVPGVEQVADGRVLVDIRADVTPAVLARIEQSGGTVVTSVPGYRAIRALLPLASLERLAALDAIGTIRTADEAVTRKDDTSAGDAAHGANRARRTHGVDGTGIGIGVLSNGVRTLADRQKSGDLPDRVTVLPGQEGTGDEGTAMLEIVHDLAPGADLYFATAWTGQAQFAANIEALCDAGADVIVDDVGYFAEPNLQDGVIAQGVDAATADGCFFFSAAGNDGNLNDGTSNVWEGDYAAGSALVADSETLGVRHDFGGGAEENPIRGGFLGLFTGTIVLQWADPLGASSNDYDLFLVDADGAVVASSTDTQDGTQDPIEVISMGFFVYEDVRLVIVKVSGADRYLRVQAFRGKLDIATAGTTYGHPAAENAIGVAAVDAASAGGSAGVFDGSESVETYSSDGPRRMFFETDGTPITAGDFSSTGGKVLKKPDLAAATCVSTATPGFSPFCGTSSAAPHAAAVAALMLEAAGGPAGVNLVQLRSAMSGAALDIEAAGVDRDSGAGIVMTARAVDAVDVAVADRNRAPTVASAVADRTVAPGSAAITVDLGSTFTDPDTTDTLTYAALSSDPVRLAVERNGARVTVTPGSPGRFVVTLRATDPDGLSAVEAFAVTVTAGNRDYDADDDGLIDVGTAARLDAVRYDLDGDGRVDGATWRPYYAAFPMGALDMGCPAGDGCTGYELTADLDLDTNGNGSADAGDTYWNAGAGWKPIGDPDAPFTADFRGNRRTVANLFIDRAAEDAVGLFGASDGSVIRGVGLTGADVTGGDGVGSLLGRGVYAAVRDSHATGSVSGQDEVGGLVGRTWGVLQHSYANVDVSGDELVGGLVGHQLVNDVVATYATGDVSGTNAVGGLVGAASDWSQTIAASYATGDVSGRGARLSDSDSGLIECRLFGAIGGTDAVTNSSGGGVGGLAGSSCGFVIASYATGSVSGTGAAGGLVGTGRVLRVPSYWDREASGVRVGVGEDDLNDNGVIDGAESHRLGVAGLTTAELQAPTGYTGIYRSWNIDLFDPLFGNEPGDPWHFGTATQYPVLSVDLNDSGGASWQEFGYQLRAGPTLTATTTAGQARVSLRWTAAGVSAWSPAPDVTYTLYRDDGGTVETVAETLGGLTYTDTGVTVGSRYTYRVAVVIDGGERVRSAPVAVTAGVANQPPVPVGTLPDRALEVGSAAVTVDVAAAFADPDSDALTYAASSSSTPVATVSVSASGVTITPVAAGRTLVSVTATETVGSKTSAPQRFTVRVGHDYDADDDGLVAIETLAQLDAVRHDLNGNGVVDDGDEAAAYAAAFPDPFDRLGCGIEGCSGYELLAGLDFDTNGNGRADAGDTYWNGGAGWEPIGPQGYQFFGSYIGGFRATFDGNGHTLANLFVARGDSAGLFGVVGSGGVIRDLGLRGVDVTGTQAVGGLAGESRGVVSDVQSAGRVSGEMRVGGLAGGNWGTITRSSSSAAVTGMEPPGADATAVGEPSAATGGLVGYNEGAIRYSFATGRVAGDSRVGGLVGDNFDGFYDFMDEGSIHGSYATGRVTGTNAVGGLVGRNTGNVRGSWFAPSVSEIHASYATGSVSGEGAVGGLVGSNTGDITRSYATGRISGTRVSGLAGSRAHDDVVTASYWDSSTSGHATGTGARTTAALQAPTRYGGIYGSWNVDVDGDDAADDPWRFGTRTQYPVLAADMNGDNRATWQEFGRQVRAGPTLSATTMTTTTAGRAQVDLTWTAVDVSHWDPAPDVTYTVTRGEGDAVEILAEGVTALRYTDAAARTGTALTYQVAAVVDGGEPVRSAVEEVNTPGNSPPLPVGTLPDRWLRVGDTAAVEVGEAFVDPESDALTYTVASSATGVATAGVAGTRVTITAVAGGAATITVTATDAGGSTASATQTFTVNVRPSSAVDYDADDDGLIEIATLAQLDAVRHDLDGDGEPTADGAAAYAAAFSTVGDRQACGGLSGCVGYELNADLDFDTNGNGRADAGDAYWNGGAGWQPLGENTSYSRPGLIVFSSNRFLAIFEGNGHTVANLFIQRDSNVGLFGLTAGSSVIRYVGLIDVTVAGSDRVGGLVGSASGRVVGSYVTGTVSGTGESAGGLVGANWGRPIVASYAAADVTGGRSNTGGLVGLNRAAVTASYATGRVAGEDGVGGLAGSNGSTITASYATGPVFGEYDVGGLVGRDLFRGTVVTASYWDTTTSRRTTGAGGEGRSTAALQTPTGYSGIYSQWNVDLDGDGVNDDPWHFGTNAQYPVLQVDFDREGQATWQEFGRQLRAGPTLTARGGPAQVALSWTAVDAGHWNPAPGVTYTLTRDDGATVETAAEELGGLTFTDTGLAGQARYTYQVAAVVAGGEATRGAPVSATTSNLAPGVNQAPQAVGSLSALTLRIADGAATVDVSGAFQDPDNDVLTYGVVSSAPAVASARMSGSVAMLTPLSAGVSTVTVTATDAAGSNTSATQQFVVTVANRPPEAVGVLSALTLRIPDGASTVDVSGAFRDLDGDALTYGAVSSSPAVATVSVSSSTLTLTPLTAGVSTVTVTATDAAGSNTSATQQFVVTVEVGGTVDYDADDDGLIEIATLAQLDAVRHDLDGDGAPTETGATAYAAAFPDPISGMGCPAAGCAGYELVADLDVDTDGSGSPDAGDAYWNDGAGWAPLGSAAAAFATTFEGNGHTVSHLFINRSDDAGLFGVSTSAIRHVGVVDAAVTGTSRVGALVGQNIGAIVGSYVTGSVSGGTNVGGLVGFNLFGGVYASYATAVVSGATSVGGLVGGNFGIVSASYATGGVTGAGQVGGLAGQHVGVVAASYATGRVSGDTEVGGLAGAGGGRVTASYWDTETSGWTGAGAGSGQSTSALQGPTGYADLYATWDVDVDGDGVADGPWQFGTAGQYPALVVDFDGDGQATWQEFGRQLREGPAVKASSPASGTPVEVSWTAVDTSHWSPPPAVTYAVYRRAGDSVTLVAAAVEGLSYTDTGGEAGVEYRYQVAVGLSGGEPSRSGAVAPNRRPEAVGGLSAVTLQIAAGASTLDVSAAFRDLDGDALTYGAASSSPAVATVSISNSTLTLTPLTAGVTTVTVTATDVAGSNTSARQQFVVTVANRPPEKVGTLSDRTLQIADGASTVDVSGAFRDLDGDALTYGAVSSTPAVATVSISNSTLTLTPLTAGASTMTVTATDAAGSNTSATQQFVVTVANRPPEAVGTLSDRTLRIADGASTVDVSGAFQDADDDELTYGAVSSTPAVATVSVSSSTLTLTPLTAGVSTVTVTATDVAGSNTSATQQFVVTVANRSPEAVGTLSALTLRIPDGASTLDVSGAFRDLDGDALTYGAVSSTPAVATVSMSSSTLTLTPLSAGVSTVTVTATDVAGSNTSATQQFVVTVANRSPETVGTLSALTLQIADGASTVDVSGAFRDLDGDALTYGAVSSTPSVATVTVSSSTLTLTPLTAGASTVTVTATDAAGSNTSARQQFVVTVANRSPEAVGTLSALTLQIADGASTVDVSGAFRDLDGDALTYGAVSSSPAVATVSVSTSTLTLTPLSAGVSTVTVTATDAGGSNTSATQQFVATVEGGDAVDYDADDDGLIEITTLAQLDAVRHDLDGDGAPAETGATAYGAAFPDPVSEMGCPSAGCAGYELVADLDFDTDGSGSPDAGDAYWNAGAGWAPLGSGGAAFATTFEGNGHTIGHLFINRGDASGLFGWTGSGSVVRNLGVVDVDVTGGSFAGGLAGTNQGAIRASYATGRVSGGTSVGGLVGFNAFGGVYASYATVVVSGETTVGGLVGFNFGMVSASYATGGTTGAGLVGLNFGAVGASYATGRVSGDTEVGGLIGAGGGRVTASYWDTETSGQTTGERDAGQSTAALQGPTRYAGLYAGWDVDVDGDGAADAAWHFGTAGQYPALVVDFDGDGQSTWQEFGHQLREGPAVKASSPASGTPAEVSWTAVDTSHWTPAPAVSYAVYRRAGDSEALVASAVEGLSYTDVGAEAGVEYRYQVASRLAGGEPSRSGAVASNRWPETVGTLSPVTLQIAAGAVTVDVSGAFRDADDDELTYGAESSVPAVAMVTVSSSTLTLTPLTAGASTVTVTATDAAGSNTPATQQFVVTVANRPPVAVGTLADLTLRVGEGATTVDLSGAFNDPDGDALTYSAIMFYAISLESAPVSIEASGSTLTVTPLAVGGARVDVGATDVSGSNTQATQRFTVTVLPAATGDYDSDDDGLIDIATLAQLDAVRHDLNGDGAPAETGATAYAAAFPDPVAGMGCPAAGCAGYELVADLDFDTDGSGSPDAADAYWNDGAGWMPLGGAAAAFATTFEGNGHTLAHLFINRGDDAGLFGVTASSSAIRHVGLVDAAVTGASRVGALVGQNIGSIRGSYATGSVSGRTNVGGLVGFNIFGGVYASYATAVVSGATSVGGLVGGNIGMVTASYATGGVTGSGKVGGLAGQHVGVVAVSYATGRVSGDTEVGGLAGAGGGRVTASYWDQETSGWTGAGAGSGQSTSALQGPTGYAGLYATWDVDVDGDGAADAPWDFGTSSAYPALAVDANGDGAATWRELGLQGRPVASATSGVRAAGMRSWGASFTDDPLQPGVTPAKAVHLLELRSRIDGLRARAGLAAFGWTDATITPGVTPARAVHLTELRKALAAAYAAAGRSAPRYTDPVVTAGVTVLKAAHLTELRAAVMALERAPASRTDR